ncbi:MAG: 8-amino-7-oxononanoate synthase [Rhodospirillaceae bacterium]|nr:8-amino-7-oxononanoate synthase [Rhodospirillaceae bacterium]
MSSLNTFAAEKLARLEAKRLRRTLIDTAREDGIWMIRGGRRLLSFSCNDYLNLTQHPAVQEAAIAAIRTHGVGAGASRLVTGNHPLFAQLETRLAALKGTEAACVFGSGYLANMGIISALMGRGDLLLVDELSHSCIMAGAALSGGTLLSFRHNDTDHAAQLLKEHRGRHRHAMIATDGVFSMDGDLAPLNELAALGREFDAWLLSDDAHGIGVVGGGRGSSFAGGHRADVALQMGTLSKAIGGYGGYLCASEVVIGLIKTRARTFIYSTALPPALAAAAIAAIDLIVRDPEYAATPLRKAKAFTARLNLPEAMSPIVPIILGDTDETLKASNMLADEGFLVTAIRPPTVPSGTSRLRLTFTAAHPDREIERLAAIIGERLLGSRT